MRKKILIVVFIFPLICSAQSIKSWDFYVAGLIPVGEHITPSHSFGMQLAVGPRIETGSVHLVPRFSASLISNNPSKEIRDNLFLYGAELDLFLPLKISSLNIEPMIGVGYARGVNFLSYREKDITGGFLSDKYTMMTSRGMIYEVGCFIRIFERIKTGVSYRFHYAKANLSDEVKSDITHRSHPTELYGEQISFPEQKMNFSNLSIGLIFSL